MSFADSLLLSAAAALVFAARRNATAAALATQYFVLCGTFWLFGVALPIRAQFLFDLTVIAVIYCKPPAHDCWPYTGWRYQLCAAWLERSFWDRIVLAIFPAMWAAYSLPLSVYHQWWALYWLAMAQFIAAGGEALQSYLTARAAKASNAVPDSSAGFEFRWIRGREQYG